MEDNENTTPEFEIMGFYELIKSNTFFCKGCDKIIFPKITIENNNTVINYSTQRIACDKCSKRMLNGNQEIIDKVFTGVI